MARKTSPTWVAPRTWTFRASFSCCWATSICILCTMLPRRCRGTGCRITGGRTRNVWSPKAHHRSRETGDAGVQMLGISPARPLELHAQIHHESLHVGVPLADHRRRVDAATDVARLAEDEQVGGVQRPTVR